MSYKQKQYRHFMVDCETFGLVPNKNPVLQIAVVFFNPATFEPELDATGKPVSFEAFLPLADQFQLGRKPDQGTVDWWQKDSMKEVAEIVFTGVSNAPPLKEQLIKLSNWIKSICALENGYAESVFWAKPTLFDYPFIDGLFIEAGIPSPFHFRKVVDMHSYIVSAIQNVHLAMNHYPIDFGIAHESYWAAFEVVKKKNKANALSEEAHNASADCLFQLEWLKEAITNCSHYASEEGVKQTLSRKD